MTKQNDYLCGRIKKIPVEYAHIKSTVHTIINESSRQRQEVYYEIEYKPIDEDEIFIGFGSYYLDYVISWLNTEFEIVFTPDTESFKRG